MPLQSVDIFAAAHAHSRPTTRDGADHPPPLSQLQSNKSQSTTTVTTINQQQATKDRKPSLTRKAASFTTLATPRRRGSSTHDPSSLVADAVVTDAAAPPALPDYALSSAAKIAPRDRDRQAQAQAQAQSESLLRSPVSPSSSGGFAKMLSRTNTASTAAPMMPPPPTPIAGNSFWPVTDANVVHQQITDLANKRIATLDYLRKAHGGRVYWFNAYMFDKADLSRMPCFDHRRLARKATNFLLLGLSLPVLVDLYSSTPIEFLRSFSTLMSEFDSFQQLRNDSSSSAALTRARLPNMFRRQGTKSRRSTSAADATAEEAVAAASMPMPGGAGNGGIAPTSNTPSVMNFAASESDLLPGEEYAYLLTPSLPFEPDYFETFATLCDALIDCYTRFLALVPTARECSAAIAELFTKADARVRKIIVQAVIKEFEDSSRANVKTEVASIGKVVLGGLM